MFFQLLLMKIFLILFVIFLILSAGFLMLSADAIRKSASSLIVSARRKAGWIALSLSCAALWASWEEEKGNSIDILSPRMFTKKAKEHESVLGLGRVRLVGRIGPVRFVREPKLSTPPHGGDGGGPPFPHKKSKQGICILCLLVNRYISVLRSYSPTTENSAPLAYSAPFCSLRARKRM